MPSAPIDIARKLASFSERWSPKIIARMNDCEFKLVKIQGEFVWHDHPDTDEAFLVLDGEMTIHFRDGDVRLQKGELYVVPRGVEHRTSAREECSAMILESAGTVNTGDAGGPMTAPSDAWV